MKLINILTEGISNIVYHATELALVLNILNQDKFKLSDSKEKYFGSQIIDKEDNYYMSVSRTSNNAYNVRSLQDNRFERELINALIVLDGKKLMYNYSGKPVINLDKKQHEERIYNSQPYIPNAKKYIKEIHILFPEINRHGYALNHNVDFGNMVKIIMNKFKIPVYLYNKKEDFIILNKNNTIPPRSISFTDESFNDERWYFLLSQSPSKTKNIPESAKYIIKMLKDNITRNPKFPPYMFADWMYSNPKYYLKIREIQNKYKLKDENDIVKFVYNKWKDAI